MDDDAYRIKGMLFSMHWRFQLQCSRSVVRLTLLSNPFVKFHLSFSGDSEFTVSGLAGEDIAQCDRVEGGYLNGSRWTVNCL